MNYINIHTSVIHSPEIKGSDPVDRATWFMLLGFCVEMENSGRILDCKSWKCRRWQQTVGVTLRELNGCSDLWRWDGDDLVIEFYPLAQQEEIKLRRDRARHNGTKGGRPKMAQEEPTSEPTLVYTRKPTSESVKERKGKEYNTPLPPEGEWEGVLPNRWRNIPKIDRRNQRALRNNPLMERMGAWFGRKPSTVWTLAEAIALHDINPEQEDIELIEDRYLAILTDKDWRRQDLITLLNNWNGELDRARIWKAENA